MPIIYAIYTFLLFDISFEFGISSHDTIYNIAPAAMDKHIATSVLFIPPTKPPNKVPKQVTEPR